MALNYDGLKKFETVPNGIMIHNTTNHAYAIINSSNNSYQSGIILRKPSVDYYFYLPEDAQQMRIYNNGAHDIMTFTVDGKVGIGTIDPDSKLTLFNNGGGDYLLNVGGIGNGKIKVRHIDGKNWGSSDVDNLYFQYGVNKHTIINAGGSTGNVGIGTADPGNYKLNVAGKIRADEIVVNSTGADFVFQPEYKLPNLSEIDNFVRKNKHLPGIAPASEMQKNGMNMSEMQTKLLQKMEEMTLYIIEQDKRIKSLEEKLKEFVSTEP